jgi:hypothetical protein
MQTYAARVVPACVRFTLTLHRHIPAHLCDQRHRRLEPRSIPFARQRQVQSRVRLRMFAGECRYFSKSRHGAIANAMVQSQRPCWVVSPPHRLIRPERVLLADTDVMLHGVGRAARNNSMPLSLASCVARAARTAHPRFAPLSAKDSVEG